MFGSIPCYPGYKNTLEYNDHYFYCELCDSIVSPTSVDVALVSLNKPVAKSESKLSVLRCKNHPIKGLQSGGPITSLKGLRPSPSTSLTETYQQMLKLCSRVHYLDILTLCFAVLTALFAIVGVIIQFVITPAFASFIPFVLLGVAIAFSLGAFSCARISQKMTREWQKLSRLIINSSTSVPVQAGSECYTLLTEFPPTCYETIRPSSSSRSEGSPYQRRNFRVIIKKTACKLSARTRKILKNYYYS
ncbi:hypothetical protein [Chlamydia sp.]|uniref:hypothetical protein n=1 Tax=Chlamydia sp. TaxID=35827 RepID=UPI0025BBA8B4|nr:hypothetical protein [Chlamydia sp.]MBQ8498214.1 hypothetical protein [Chlamydia sp.]